MNAPTPVPAEVSGWQPLIDVSGLAVADLIAQQDSVLAQCVSRLMDSLDDPDGVISAFQSFAS